MKTRSRSVMSFVITTALLLGSSAFGQQKSREKKILTEQQIKELLDPVRLTGLDKSKYLRKQ